MIEVAVALEDKGGEANLRAAAGRTYYAVVSAARIAFDKPLEQDFPIHQKLPKWIAAHFSAEDADSICRTIHALYAARILADYNLAASMDRDSVGESIELATGLVDRLADYSEGED